MRSHACAARIGLLVFLFLRCTAAGSDVAPLVVPAAAFRSDSAGMEAYRFEDYGSIRGVGSTVNLFAPVYLPHGAVVTHLEAFVIDPTDACAQNEIRVHLERTGHDGAIPPVAMAWDWSATNSLNIQVIEDTSITYATIDNTNYHSYLHVSLCSSLWVPGSRPCGRRLRTRPRPTTRSCASSG